MLLMEKNAKFLFISNYGMGTKERDPSIQFKWILVIGWAWILSLATIILGTPLGYRDGGILGLLGY